MTRELVAVSADGTPIVMTATGDGPPLLAVHGASASHHSWASLTPLLAPSFTVFAVARRGHPPSGDAAAYTLRREFEDIAACVHAIDAPTRVLGHSSGGLCTLEAALESPGIDRIVLYEPALGLSGDPSDLVRELDALIADGRREDALLTFLTRATSTSDDTIQRLRSSAGWDDRVAAVATVPRELTALHEYRFDPRRVAELRVPTLLVRGSRSAPRSAEVADRLARVITTAEIAVLPDQAHTAHLDAPATLADTILDFLRAEH